ncbi:MULTISPECIES: response regulator transcription factor [unclassified Facklamia]|uniref:response regulator transcription factor n=1 Tax=Aerococcaceae TaxID=186827 RepID=UPI0013BBA1BA|nr:MULTISPECIES: response regulator transcription factor [unclassified Facklamia]MBS4462666.1 response regulator transcription factor [Aerococcaceae bacterium zg-B36]NEW65205.1 response regulator [Facklamia sp. 252]NEW68394.1 response regulator [Facklamia sp. 253]QQD66213.1 response regulator transcription factor [Aerococcaceae bacterium zg-252]
MKGKLLLVEDDDITREAATEFLKVKGYDVISVADGETAIATFEAQHFDVVILDIMLPKVDGFGVLKAIRAQKQTCVLMLTAMTDDKTQIMSFDYQADDYMSKPFSLAILEKRVEALMRRSQPQSNKEEWVYGDAKVNLSGFSATYQGVEVDIKPKEIKILNLLIDHPGQVFSRDQILDKLWFDETPYDRVIDVYIKNLRKKLHLDCIKTVKNVGYKYEGDV